MDRLASINGKTTATTATIDLAIAGLWNPSSTRTIWVREIHVFKQTIGAADEPVIRRVSARGTATGTTSTIANDWENTLAPPSGAAIDLNYTVQPTFVGTAPAGVLGGSVLPAAIASGMVWAFQKGIMLLPGTGVVLATGIALAFPVSRVTFVWAE